MIFQTSIIVFHVNLPGCTFPSLPLPPTGELPFGHLRTNVTSGLHLRFDSVGSLKSLGVCVFKDKRRLWGEPWTEITLGKER